MLRRSISFDFHAKMDLTRAVTWSFDPTFSLPCCVSPPFCKVHVLGGRSYRTAQKRKYLFKPTCFSWLDQVEISSARLKWEVIAGGVSTSVKDLERKLMRDIEVT